MTGQDITPEPLVDYQYVALSGAKLIAPDTDPVLLDALARLVDVGLATVEEDSFSLLPPEYAAVVEEDLRELFDALRNVWLRGQDESDDDQVLYGDLGYWTHWWNVLHEHPDRASEPMQMDVVVADDGTFTVPTSTEGFDPAIVEYIVENRLITGRFILPYCDVESPVAELARLGQILGAQVRVLPSPGHYAIYDATAAVLREASSAGPVAQRLTRRPAVVESLRQLFTLQWSMAMPWEDYVKGGADILSMLAEGWTDERIAAELNISVRTVSRRVSEAMLSVGARSRFELGVRFAQARLGSTSTD